MALRKRSFLITGTGARVGKTTVGCALGFAMRARGLRVGVMKPIDSLESQDVQSLALAVGSTIPPELLCPYREASTLARADADLAHIVRCFNDIAEQNDVVLVESAGTIETPITPAADFADLA